MIDVINDRQIKMDERKVADYFVVAGLSPNFEPVDDLSKEGTHMKPDYDKPPIIDITVIFPTLGENIPDGYTLLKETPTGLPADLNHGSLRSPEVFLCYRRGRFKPPLVDIGVLYEGKDRVMDDSEVVDYTFSGRSANINNSATKTLVTYRRASPTMSCNSLVVTDIVVIIANKGETPPHAFCMIKKNLNKGLVGSDVYLCYKKSMNRANLLVYKPELLLRYPFEDNENLPLPGSVPLFCLPMGCSLERWPAIAEQPLHTFSTFVLTNDAAEKLYGSAVTFYERYPFEKLTKEQRIALDPNKEEKNCEWTYNVNKCICLLSRWPYFDTFEPFLSFIHEMSKSDVQHLVPIERFVSFLLEDIPFPSPQRPRILIQLSVNDKLILTQPEDLPLPRSGASFRSLLMYLGPENCLLMLLCALTEQKILVHSLRPDALTAVSEAISMMVFPFKWQCPYIPLCPLTLAEVLHAPLPFLIGVDSRFFDIFDPPLDVNCIDLDTNNITLCEEKRSLSAKLLPKKSSRALRTSLENLYRKLNELVQQTTLHSNNTENQPVSDNIIDKDFQLKRQEQNLELEIQEAFLKFMSTVLKGYRNYLLPIIKAPTMRTTDTNSLFDLQEFIKSRDKANLKFYSLVTKTQMFIRFIEERSFVSDMDASLAFFDECVDKVETDEDSCRLIELDDSHRSERTMFIMPPEPIGLPIGLSYSYEIFQLNPELFCQQKSLSDSKKVKSHITRLSSSGIAPGSPMARRTKHEIKMAQRLARKLYLSTAYWPRCLIATCFSIWFIHLPSYILMSQSRAPMTLRYAYDLLCRAHKNAIVDVIDEVCYRVMMQLCGVYSQPVVAVRLLFLMKRAGLQPNAITYGFYNRAVLEATWPSGMNNNSQILWNKLRNVVLGAALFRRAGIIAGERRKSLSTEGGNSTLELINDSISHYASVESVDCPTGCKISEFNIGDSDGNRKIENLTNENDIIDESTENSEQRMMTNTAGFVAFDKFRNRVGSIVRPSGLPLLTPTSAFKQQPFESSAGLLITSRRTGIPLMEEDIFDFGSNLESSGPPQSPSILSNKKRGRSGSCTDFPQAHLRNTPTSPKPTNNHCYKILTRSESFANDAGILAKLTSLNHDLITNSSDVPDTQINLNNKSNQLSVKSAFKKGNLRRIRDNESCDSSTENLGSSIGSINLEHISDFNKSNSVKSNGFKYFDSKKANATDKFNNLSATINEERLGDGDKSRKNISPIKSPSRTPVTENDPLGALNEDFPIQNGLCEPVNETNKKPVSRVSSEIELDKSGAPILFQRRTAGEWGVTRSATFAGDSEEENDKSISGSAGNLMHRSSTMPSVDEVPPPNTASTTENNNNIHHHSNTLGSLGSSFKISFNRYSPSRFSLRKATDIKNTAQIIENAINNFSTSSLTSKKSNEIFLGGLSSLKNAATSVAKKFDEIKEAISANSTPIKAGNTKHLAEKEFSYYEDDNEYYEDNVSSKRKISNEYSSSLNMAHHNESWGSNLYDLMGDNSRKGSITNLGVGDTNPWSSQQCILLPKLNKDLSLPVALQIIMTTCSKCHNCLSSLYDEEIMAGWVPEDSNLNTKCQFCDKETVPFICVTVIDYRNSPMPNSSQDCIRERKLSSVSLGASRTSIHELNPESRLQSSNLDGMQPKSCEPITVPYLNPLVLRKEFESILATEGDCSLTQSKFVDEHPIIYWNMVWVFARIGVESHLPGLTLKCSFVLSDPHISWQTADASNVLISTLWHNPRLYEEAGQPMFMLYNQQDDERSSLVSALVTDHTTVPRSVMDKVISCLQCSDMIEPLRFLAKERQKLKGRGHSLYRDILFLGMTVLGRDNIDQAAFDREYTSAFNKLHDKDSKLFMKCDQPISTASLYCRSYFRQLEL